MSDSPSSGGAAHRRKRGLKAVLVPLTPEAHAAIKSAAHALEMTATQFCASVLEGAAKKTLKKANKGG